MDPVFVQRFSLVASTVILAFIFFGVSQRRRPRVHIPVMLSCCAADLTMVLFIELNRGAVEKALVADGLLRFHVIVSVIAVVCWGVALFTGWKRRQGKCRRLHLANALVFLVCRTTNWATSFFIHS